jgi:hypothetical protein
MVRSRFLPCSGARTHLRRTAAPVPGGRKKHLSRAARSRDRAVEDPSTKRRRGEPSAHRATLRESLHIAQLIELAKSSVLHAIPSSPLVCAVMSMLPPGPPAPPIPGTIVVVLRSGSVPPLTAMAIE